MTQALTWCLTEESILWLRLCGRHDRARPGASCDRDHPPVEHPADRKRGRGEDAWRIPDRQDRCRRGLAAQGIERGRARWSFAKAGAVVYATDINDGAARRARQRPSGITDPQARCAERRGGQRRLLPRSARSTCCSIAPASSIPARSSKMKDADLEFALQPQRVRAMMRTIRAVPPGMLERGGGVDHQHVVGCRQPARACPTASPMASPRPRSSVSPRQSPPTMSGKGIRCNAICPRHGREPVARSAGCGRKGDYETARAAFIARQPMGRLGVARRDRRPRRLSGRRDLYERPSLRYRRRLDDLIRHQAEKRDMKLVRYGESRPRAAGVDRCGRARSATCRAMCSTLPVRGVDPGCAGRAVEGRSQSRCRLVSGEAAHRRLRCRHRQVHLHRPQLFRPCRRDRRHGAAGADHLHEGELGDRRPGRRRADPARFA